MLEGFEETMTKIPELTNKQWKFLEEEIKRKPTKKEIQHLKEAEEFYRNHPVKEAQKKK